MTTRFSTVYAATDDGLTLPVVDVTNPSFALSITDAEIEARAGQFVAESASRGEMPTARPFTYNVRLTKGALRRRHALAVLAL